MQLQRNDFHFGAAIHSCELLPCIEWWVSAECWPSSLSIGQSDFRWFSMFLSVFDKCLTDREQRCQKTQKAEEQWILDKGFLFAAANGVCSCILAEVSTVKHNSLFVEQCPFETSWDWLLDVHPQKFSVDKVCGNVITYTSSLSSASTAGTWNAALVLLQKMGQAGDLTRRWERCQDPTIFRISDPRSKYQSED